MNIAKKNQYGVAACILCVLLWAGCDNQLAVPGMSENPGKGRVVIQIGKGGNFNSRTLHPSPYFSAYELQFTPKEGQVPVDPKTVDLETDGSAPIVCTLAEGKWTITAIAYVTIEGVSGMEKKEAARGSAELDVSAEAGETNSVTINIKAGAGAEQGFFRYALSYPTDSEGSLSVYSISKTSESLIEYEELAGAAGSTAIVSSEGVLPLASGYYLLEIELKRPYVSTDDPGGTLVKTEVIKVDENFTTWARGADYTFTTDDFLFNVDTEPVTTPGKMTEYIYASVNSETRSFKMAAVPARIKFPKGQNDNTSVTLPFPYQIGETEVTWGLWSTVRTWAAEKGYTIGEGQAGSAVTGGDTQPVTNINWYDAVVWCNALTEYWNEKMPVDFDPVYKNSSGQILKDAEDSAAFTGVTIDLRARGFRLPTNDEWEFAARCQINANAVSGVFTKGTFASGAAEDNAESIKAVAVCDTTGTAVVKSKAANALGIFDMSGNVWEWCFEDASSRGGSYQDDPSSDDSSSEFLNIGYAGPSSGPSDKNTYTGFRLARTGYKENDLEPPPSAGVTVDITFSVSDLGNNVTVAGADDKALPSTVSRSTTTDLTLKFTAPEGYSVRNWIVNDTNKPGNASLTLSTTEDLALGPNSITLVIEMDGVPYSSATISVTVTP